jgi:transposase
MATSIDNQILSENQPIHELYAELEVRIYAILGTSKRLRIGVVNLYHLARAIDTGGSGYATLDIPAVAKLFQCSEQTVKRWLVQSNASGALKVIWRRERKVRVKYLALEKLCLKLGLRDLGAIVEILGSDLPNLKVYCIHSQLQANQEQSRYAAKQSLPKGMKLIDVDDVLFPQSRKCRGLEVKQNSSGRCCFVNDAFPLFGAGQNLAAKKLNISDRTVRRYISAAYLKKKGLKPLQKKQIVQTRPEYDVIRHHISEGESYPRFFMRDGKAFKAHCNIYERQFDLRSCRRARSRLKNAFDASVV